MSKAFFFPVVSREEVLYQGFQGRISHGIWRDSPATKALMEQVSNDMDCKMWKRRETGLEAHYTKDWQIALCIKRQLFVSLISPIKALQRH